MKEKEEDNFTRRKKGKKSKEREIYNKVNNDNH